MLTRVAWQICKKKRGVAFPSGYLLGGAEGKSTKNATNLEIPRKVKAHLSGTDDDSDSHANSPAPFRQPSDFLVKKRQGTQRPR